MSDIADGLRFGQKLRLMPYVVWVVLGFLPLLFWHIGGLLEKPHYQFLFLMPITVWILVSSIPDREVSGKFKRWEILTAASVLLVSLAGLAVAAWVWSPWLGAVCFQFAWGSAVLAQSGWRRSQDWLPLWFFSWIIIPLPFGMDEDLIISLRGYTTRISSSILDQIGLLHNSYANVIELPGKPLFIADACSGIHSLYVLMAGALFLCCWAVRGLMHSLLLLASTFFLVLIENVARIVLVAVAWDKGWDWSVGFNHELLGIFLFVFSLFIIVTTDQLLQFVFPPDAPPLMQRIRNLKGAADKRHYDSEEKKLPRRSVPAADWMTSMAKRIAFVFPCMVVLQLFNAPAAVPNVMAVMDQDFDLPPLGEDALPETLNGFTRMRHDTVARVPGDPFGQGSQQWVYSKDGLECLISVDYPYDVPHDVTVCYTNIGWSASSKEILTPAAAAADSVGADSPIGLAKLTRPLYGEAVLIFNHTDLAGRTTAILKDVAPKSAEQKADARWTAFFERPADQPNAEEISDSTFLQFQLFVRSPTQFSEEQNRQLIELFNAAKAQLEKQLELQKS